MSSASFSSAARLARQRASPWRARARRRVRRRRRRLARAGLDLCHRRSRARGQNADQLRRVRDGHLLWRTRWHRSRFRESRARSPPSRFFFGFIVIDRRVRAGDVVAHLRLFRARLRVRAFREYGKGLLQQELLLFPRLRGADFDSCSRRVCRRSGEDLLNSGLLFRRRGRRRRLSFRSIPRFLFRLARRGRQSLRAVPQAVDQARFRHGRGFGGFSLIAGGGHARSGSCGARTSLARQIGRAKIQGCVIHCRMRPNGSVARADGSAEALASPGALPSVNTCVAARGRGAVRRVSWRGGGSTRVIMNYGGKRRDSIRGARGMRRHAPRWAGSGRI